MLYEDALGRLITYEERLKVRGSSSNGDRKLLLIREEWRVREKEEEAELAYAASRGRDHGYRGSRGQGNYDRGRARGRGREFVGRFIK